MASGILTHNPVALIKFKRAERQTRDALSEDEIKAFLGRIKDSKYDNIRQFAYILYFFGLRPCEIDEKTRREGDFLIARNRKRKKVCSFCVDKVEAIDYKDVAKLKEKNNSVIKNLILYPLIYHNKLL